MLALGDVGFEALGEILSGKVNPSGLVRPDTFPYDLEAAPWWNNGTYTDYTNLADMAVEGLQLPGATAGLCAILC